MPAPARTRRVILDARSKRRTSMFDFHYNLACRLGVSALAATWCLGLAGSALAAGPSHSDSHGAPAGVAAAAPGAVDIVRHPSDLPGALGKRAPQRVRVDLETVEVTGQLDSGTTYRYWTFNKKVPGPFVRVRVGDTVEVVMQNDGGSG